MISPWSLIKSVIIKSPHIHMLSHHRLQEVYELGIIFLKNVDINQQGISDTVIHPSALGTSAKMREYGDVRRQRLAHKERMCYVG